jgi:Zn-dependent alcohol dehydrogenase
MGSVREYLLSTGRRLFLHQRVSNVAYAQNAIIQFDALWSLLAESLVAEERTLKGSYIGTCVPARDIPHYIALYMQGRLPVNKLLTGHLTREEINHGFDLLHEGKAMRQVVVFE